MEYRIGKNRALKSIDDLPPVLDKDGDRVIFDGGQTTFADRPLKVFGAVQFFADGNDRAEVKSNLKPGAIFNFYRPGFSFERINGDTRNWFIDVKDRATDGRIVKVTQRGKGRCISFQDSINMTVQHFEHQSDRRGDSQIYCGGNRGVCRNINISDVKIVKGQKNIATHGIRCHESENVTVKRFWMDGTEGRNPINFRDGMNYRLEDATVIGGICEFGPLGDGDGDTVPGWENLRLKKLDVLRLKIVGGLVTLEAGLEDATFTDCTFEHPDRSPIVCEGNYGPRPPAFGCFVNCDFNSPKEPLGGFGERYKHWKFHGCRHNGKAYVKP